MNTNAYVSKFLGRCQLLGFEQIEQHSLCLKLTFSTTPPNSGNVLISKTQHSKMKLKVQTF